MNHLTTLAQIYSEEDFQDYQQQDYERIAPKRSEFSVKDLSGLGTLEQANYAQITNNQNDLAVLQAGISAIGQEVWDTIYSNVFDAVNAGTAPVKAFESYDTAMSALLADSKNMIVTPNSVPDPYYVQTATDHLNYYTPMLNYALQMAPELTPSVQADMAQTSATVTAAPPLQNPTKVGMQTFQDELAKRAQALGQGILDWTKYVAWGIGGIVGIYVLSQLSGGRRAA